MFKDVFSLPRDKSHEMPENVEREVCSLLTHAKSKSSEITSTSRILNKLDLVSDLVRKNSAPPDALFDIEKKLDMCLDILNKTEPTSSSLVITQKVNPNQHVDKQIRFFSTKKKSHVKPMYRKPLHNEKLSIVAGLQSLSQETCNVHTGDDHTYYTS